MPGDQQRLDLRPTKPQSRGWRDRLRVLPALAACLLAALAAAAVAGPPGKASAAGQAGDRRVLRVCADPNNMPFSNAAGEGFENEIAELVAADLGWDLAYTWHAQRRGFIRRTLKAGRCDVIMGVPNMDMIGTTRAYYRSTYVFVSRADRGLAVSSMQAPELADLRIGVHLVGDDGTNTPPAHALGRRGIVDNVVGYTLYGDYREDSPPRDLIDAVVDGEIDVAAAWGPLAGYHALHAPVPLRVTPITDTIAELPLVFRFGIAMGFRKEDTEMKNLLTEVIERRRPEIEAILRRYGVPMI